VEVALEDYLAAGIAAAKNGDLARARVLLSWAVQRDPDSEQGWLWLGRCSCEPSRRAFCFNKVLSLNPDNFEAQREYRRACSGRGKPIFSLKQELACRPSYLAAIASLIIGGLIFTGFVAAAQLFGILDLSSLIPDRFNQQTDAALSQQYFDGSDQDNQLLSFLYLQQTAEKAGPVIPEPIVEDSGAVNAIRLRGAETDLNTAQTLMEQKQYLDALPYIDKAITAVPEFSEAYFRRALCHYQLSEIQQMVVHQKLCLERGLSDVDTAISLGWQDGEAFFLRYQILKSLSTLQVYRADREYLLELALQNLGTSISAGYGGERIVEHLPETLLAMSRCGEAIKEIERIKQSRTISAPPSSSLDYLDSQGWLCRGEYDIALLAVERGLEIEQQPEMLLLKSIILYHSGRLNEAIEAANILLASSDEYRGEGYSLRALSYYEKGQKSLALMDLNQGSVLSLNQPGLRSYLLGKIALDEPNHQQALELFQEALVSLEWFYSPLFPEIEQRLADLDGLPMIPVASVALKATPMPVPRDGSVSFFASPPSNLPGKDYPLPPSSISASFEHGSGPVRLDPFNYPVIQFSPSEALSIRTVNQLTLDITGSPGQAGKTPFIVFLWKPHRNTWQMLDLSWGKNLIEEPNHYFDQDGSFFLALYCRGAETVEINNIEMDLEITTMDWKVINYELKR
jgi:tetratricopeptide (TPR) repeat protein